MIQITSKLVEDRSVRLFLQQSPKMFNEVYENSLEKTIKVLRLEAKKLAPQELGVQKDIEHLKYSKITKASADAGQASAELYLTGNKLPFWKFGSVSPRGIMKGKTTGGVTVNIAGRGINLKHAFVTNMGRGDVGVYERILGKYIKRGRDKATGNPRINEKKREATRFVATGSFAAMTKSQKTKIPNILQARAQEVFEQEFIKQCDAHLTAMGAK